MCKLSWPRFEDVPNCPHKQAFDNSNCKSEKKSHIPTYGQLDQFDVVLRVFCKAVAVRISVTRLARVVVLS